MNLTNRSLQPGFNFIELMIALVIIGMIVGLIGPRVMGLLTRGERTSTENTLKVVKSAIKQFRMEVGTYPAHLQDLVKRPEEASSWSGPYVGDEDSASPEVPKDAWGQDLVYKVNPRGSTPAFELYSQGNPDKEDDRIYAK